MAEQLYFLGKVHSPWGDYGNVLQHGITTHEPRQHGCLSLERTGPNIFPITFPFHLVVTQDFRILLETSGLTGFTFRPVIKHRIVELGLEEWDFTANEPPEYPESGEPEDYILSRPHSPAASTAMGELWEVVLQPGVDVIRSKKGTSTHITLRPETWNGSDLFHPRSTTIDCISSKARDWFHRHFADYVSIRAEYERSP